MFGGSLLLMSNISTLHLRLCVICVRRQGHAAQQVSGRGSISVTLKADEGGVDGHFSPSSANIRPNISRQWSSHKGRFRFFARPLSAVYDRESAQFAPSGRPSRTEKSLTAAGEEVDERMAR